MQALSKILPDNNGIVDEFDIATGPKRTSYMHNHIISSLNACIYYYY